MATRNVIVLNTETTGLDDQAEVLQIALLSTQGAVAHAPSFPAVYQHLVALLRKRFVAVYNAAFDRRILHQTCARYGLPALCPAAWHCPMLEYEAFTGL